MTEPRLFTYSWYNPLDAVGVDDLADLRPAIDIRAIVRPESGEFHKIRWMLEKALRDMVALMMQEEKQQQFAALSDGADVDE